MHAKTVVDPPRRGAQRFPPVADEELDVLVRDGDPLAGLLSKLSFPASP